MRKYAYRNALLPQITGLALALGAVVAGAIVVEIVFSYPGLGYADPKAIQNRDYFLIQGIFLFLIIGVLIANFIIDIAYVFVDPRTRIGMQGELRHDHDESSPVRRPSAPRDDGPASVAAPRRPRRSALYFAFATGSSWSAPRCRARVLRARALRPAAHRRRRRSSSAARPTGRPSSEYWFGTTSFGQDVFAQFVHGLRATLPRRRARRRDRRGHRHGVGFIAGYRGGLVDDVLNMLTNVVLVIPTLAILIIVAAYLERAQLRDEAILIGLTSWPWAARAVRAQTFSLRTREFVDIARLSGRRTRHDHRDARSRRT